RRAADCNPRIRGSGDGAGVLAGIGNLPKVEKRAANIGRRGRPLESQRAEGTIGACARIVARDATGRGGHAFGRTAGLFASRGGGNRVLARGIGGRPIPSRALSRAVSPGDACERGVPHGTGSGRGFTGILVLDSVAIRICG